MSFGYESNIQKYTLILRTIIVGLTFILLAGFISQLIDYGSNANQSEEKINYLLYFLIEVVQFTIILISIFTRKFLLYFFSAGIITIKIYKLIHFYVKIDYSAYSVYLNKYFAVLFQDFGFNVVSTILFGNNLISFVVFVTLYSFLTIILIKRGMIFYSEKNRVE